jgi:hypothetical protein
MDHPIPLFLSLFAQGVSFQRSGDLHGFGTILWRGGFSALRLRFHCDERK